MPYTISTFKSIYSSTSSRTVSSLKTANGIQITSNTLKSSGQTFPTFSNYGNTFSNVNTLKSQTQQITSSRTSTSILSMSSMSSMTTLASKNTVKSTPTNTGSHEVLSLSITVADITQSIKPIESEWGFLDNFIVSVLKLSIDIMILGGVVSKAPFKSEFDFLFNRNIPDSESNNQQ